MPETSGTILLGAQPSLSAPEAAEPQDLDLEFARAEFERIESLLAVRARNLDTLQREFDRRDRLLREALERLPTSASHAISALARGQEAAVTQAIDAEVARAELSFALDETRLQLKAAPVQLHEARPSGAGDAHQPQSDVLLGQLAGLAARLDEAERAWQHADAIRRAAELRSEQANERVLDARAEAAQLSLQAQARAARLEELSQALASEQREVQSLRAQPSASAPAGTALDAAEHERLRQRVQELEAREQAAHRAASESVVNSDLQLRDFLTELEEPLRQLDASLSDLRPGAPQQPTLGEQPDDAGTSKRPRPSTRAIASLKGELIDTRVDAARLADDLTRERTRRRKLATTVRALQAASDSGDSVRPWIEELVQLLAEANAS